jgi:hypothetical protein
MLAVNLDTIVLQLLDISCFYTRTPDVSRQLARKGDDSIYNMEGKVQVCSRDVQNKDRKELFV